MKHTIITATLICLTAAALIRFEAHSIRAEGTGPCSEGDSTLIVLSLPSEEVPIKQWLNETGWEEQRGSAKHYRVFDSTLFMTNDDATTVVGTKFKPKIDPLLYPLIEFHARVEEIPPGADVTSRKMDDAAFRLFVVFDRGGGLFSPPETIGYVWDSTLKTGTTGRSASFKQVRYIVIGSGSDGLGEWKTFKRNILEDYESLFNTDDVPDIGAIALKCDSNHSGGRAASAIQWIRLEHKDHGANNARVRESVDE
jgi:hypothetical protein